MWFTDQFIGDAFVGPFVDALPSFVGSRTSHSGGPLTRADTGLLVFDGENLPRKC